MMNGHVWRETDQTGGQLKGRPRVNWQIMTRPKKEGGMKMVDPECMIDACKMKIIKKMMTKDRQPWMKWVERKMENKKNEWGMWGGVLGARMTKKRMNDLKDDCFVESMMKIWYEIGGTTRYAYENMREESEEEERRREELMEEVRNLLEVTNPDGREKREEE